MSDELKARDNAIRVLERLKADVPYYMGDQPKAVHYQAIHAGLDTALQALRGASGGGAGEACDDCPPDGYPTDKTRCLPCPRRASLNPQPTPAAATVGAVEQMKAALKMIQGYGCPVCSGDCGSANPPVIFCPMQQISEALTTRTGKGDEK